MVGVVVIVVIEAAFLETAVIAEAKVMVISVVKEDHTIR